MISKYPSIASQLEFRTTHPFSAKKGVVPEQHRSELISEDPDTYQRDMSSIKVIQNNIYCEFTTSTYANRGTRVG